ncbi:uncharacterized protein K444DRAFT_316875 [Hyaloscypha bicolor E]|uniref:DUF7580 domain-containing protein n=1 Tax=Hyaloscypha bicolor E TaxID=1095630 RepID=A0A2J6TLP5_9HELO|nr:uncharacterized protein K444DRAFT_316875 [Hyaloscypha bicolor E]PMD63951.1 hypothetical protein K444DRAFT_316875 [Hyaloscypha bicolor E]
MSLNSILAWRIISALSGYLIFTLPETVEDFDCLDEAAILIGNSKENFDFELTRVFVRPRLPCDIPPERIATCEEKLVKVILLLESLVNPSHNQKFTGQEPDNKFGHLFSHDTKYKRLWALLELLETSRVPFNLINGPLGPAFNLPPDDSVAANLETVLDLNHFLDSVPLPQQTKSIPAALESSDSVEIQDSSIRDYATSAFGAIFSHLQHCQTEHKLMLYLPKQHDSSDCAPKILLDMFISVCPDHCDWQETQCGKRENLDVGPRTVRNMDLCSKIKDSQSDREGLHLHVTGDQIQNLSQATQTTLHSNKFPRKSLHTLLESGAFKGFDLNSMTSNRFSRGQKRTLATSIASSLCRLLGSEWVGKGWCAKDMLFLADEDGQSESDIPVGPFISCSPAGPYLADYVKWESKLANTKPPVFLFLGKLLLEIDLGGSLDSHIEEELKKDTKETVWLLLSGIYKNSKGHLEYGDAIDACLRFHKVRKIKFEAEELTGDPGEWCEWDRRYIKDVVEKLVVPSTSIPTAAKTTTSKVDHHGGQKTIQDTSKHSYLFSIRPRNSPRTSNSQGSGSRDNTSSASAVFSVPPQSSSSSSSSVSEVHHYQNSAPSKISKSQQYMSGDNQGDNSLDMTKATPNYHMSRWFAGLDGPNDTVHLNSQEPWQFFEIENTELEGENKRHIYRNCGAKSSPLNLKRSLKRSGK